MKMSTKYILWSLYFFTITMTAQQANQKFNMKIDPIGNAVIDISMTMNAQQWDAWNATYGNNPAGLKREIERSMPAFFMDDFKLEKDDMNRSFNLSMNAYGVCEVDKRGKWMVDTDQKNAQLTELTDHKYMLVSSPPELGGMVQQTFIIEFPETAKNIKVDTDAYGKSLFEFKMEPLSSGFNLLQWSGLLIFVLGLAWTGFIAFSKNTRTA